MDPEEQPSLHTPFIDHLFRNGWVDIAAQFPSVPIPSLQGGGGDNMPLPPSRPSVRESNPRRLERFLASVAVEEEASVAGSAHLEEEGGGGAAGSLW